MARTPSPFRPRRERRGPLGCPEGTALLIVGDERGCRGRPEGRAAGLPVTGKLNRPGVMPGLGRLSAVARAHRAAPAPPGVLPGLPDDFGTAPRPVLRPEPRLGRGYWAALLAKAAGAGQRAGGPSRPHPGDRAQLVPVLRCPGGDDLPAFPHLGPCPGRSPARGGRARRSFRRRRRGGRLGGQGGEPRLRPRPVWSWASRMSRGGPLSNTTWPYPAPP